MPDKHLYEYATLRVVPRVEREEFLNVGVVVFCKEEKYLQVRYKLDSAKLLSLCQDLDLEQLEKNLQSFKLICEGAKNGGPIAQMDIPSRFRWLTAVRSSVIQTSRPHPGLCTDLDLTLQRLFSELVL
ncbi:DUF3037 domain-containing protein [Salinimicrobium tongyeongense]|uniref:DUF3037 domain-containing protein n=1 Tax=Salinimicrobium tongyeongense TaxID=2809707 RepID=A0ABY6NPA6_9FLAO|nr:DUF3037 domain-containing protein [Salinimicrobium tongyeongense]UZH54697.1 DUF3037 domain-containing protein [Salinimicrobium tongyeongense]